MKRVLLYIIICCAFISVYAERVKVTMKNGTVLTGELKELAPTDHVTVIVAGLETMIPISEVASIDNPENSLEPIAQRQVNGDNDTKLQYGKYAITDTKEYPESFTLKIGNQELTMVLVRGGWFNMGFDGRHSLSWDSEPIHRVTLSSYYVSTRYLNCHVAEAILKKKKISNSVKPYNCKYRKEAEKLIEEICMLSCFPFRLLTEAEWEYATLMPNANYIFGNNNKDLEWCSDFFERYSAADQVNPQGPTSGKNHVVRSYSPDNEKWKRFKVSQKLDWGSGVYVRIAISADQIRPGIEMTIPTPEELSVEEYTETAELSSETMANSDTLHLHGKYEITDTKQYPDSFVLNVGNQELTMILVRGGWFYMGYDGKHSSSWDSEPVHRVTLSSYYISKQSHQVNCKQNADDLLSNLAKSTAKPYRLPTEAEWEYVALMPFADNIFRKENQREWCSDFWGPYGAEDQINPQGPEKGKSHVLRAFSRRNEKWHRYKGFIELGQETTKTNEAYIRIVISADQINE